MQIFLRNRFPRLIICIFCALLAPSLPAHAEETSRVSAKALFPNQLSIQTAGYLGFVALGAGYAFFNGAWQTELFYGYVPRRIGGYSLYLISWKNSISPFRIRLTEATQLTPLYIGCSAIAGLDKRLYVRSGKASSKMIFNSALHFSINAGFELMTRHYALGQRRGLYVELCALYDYLRLYADHPSTIKFKDIATLAFGIKIAL